MAEVERVKKADAAANAFLGLRKEISKIVAEEICPPVSAIDRGNFDDWIFMDGKWKRRSGKET